MKKKIVWTLVLIVCAIILWQVGVTFLQLLHMK